jgi:hypothetical protein
MAWVKTFRIHPNFGVPDKDIQEFIRQYDRTMYVDVKTTYIPPYGETTQGQDMDPKLTIIITKIEDKGYEENYPILREASELVGVNGEENFRT